MCFKAGTIIGAGFFNAFTAQANYALSLHNKNSCYEYCSN